MSIVIDNITYNIEDEEVDEIEYLEILTVDEIIKDNPNFIAFSREEIFNELYDFFKDSNKADGVADLFFRDKAQNIKNFVFVTSAQKKTFECMEENMQELVDEMKRLSKQENEVRQKEKNKFFFALKYDDNKLIRLKPHMKTTVKIDDGVGSGAYYPVYADDDTNLPVVAAYYKQPGSAPADKLYHKILEHMKKPIVFNYADSDGYADVGKLIKAVKPKMKTILENLAVKDDEEVDDRDLDHNDLNAFLMRFDTSLDDISTQDNELLRVHLEGILKEKEDEIKYGKYKIKEVSVSNDKIKFFDQIGKKGLVQLLDITDKMKQDYTLLVERLEEEKMNINAPPLLYNNVNDMIRAVINNDVQLEDILENLKANRDVLVINHAINTIKGLTSNDVEGISGMLDHLTQKFERLKAAINPVFKFQFIDFYHDVKEVKEAGDYSQYEGVPDVYRNNGNYEGMQSLAADDDMPDEETMFENIAQINVGNLEKYWLSIKYRDAVGFTEMLKDVLPVVQSVSQDAKLGVNYERLCDELFKHFRGIASKYDMLQAILAKADIKLADDFVRDLVKISPVVALNASQTSALMTDDLVVYVQQCNRQYCNILYDMLCVGLCWWCLQIQEDIINDKLVYDENSLQVRYYDLWSVNGLPLRDSKAGVLVYIATIFGDVLEETGYDFLLGNGPVLNKLIKTVGNEYQDVVDGLREQSKHIESKRMVKGKQTYDSLAETFRKKDKNSLLQNYIDALVYYPSYKYKAIHKVLLGCCTQQIGLEFESFSDMKNRKDLVAGKKQLQKKMGLKRYSLYTPKKVVEDQGDEEDEEFEGEEFEVPERPPALEANKGVLEGWLESMVEVESPLLPEDHIYTFMTSTKQAITFSKSYVQLFCKTAGYKPNELQALLDNNEINFQSVMLMLCTIYQKYPKNNEIEERLLKNAINTIKDCLKHWKSLIKFSTEYIIQDIKNLQMYVLCRAICLPSNPDISKNILQLSVQAGNSFLATLCKTVYTSLLKHLRMAAMPDEITNQLFISSIREQNKVKQLALMNTKTADERGLMQQIKKIGLQYDDKYNDEQQNEVFNINDQYVGEGERDDDFVLGNQDEYGDDNEDDYGFIYS